MEHFDVIVVGIGGMGSATVYALARYFGKRKKILGIERFTVPNNLGSSHGHSRIIRLAYFEDPSYVPLARRALDNWKDVQRISGTKLFEKTGSLDCGPADDDLFERSRQSCREFDLEFEELDASEVNKRYPGYQLPGNFRAIYQPEGGILDPEKCVATFVKLAKRLGVEINENEKVLSFDLSDPDTITVKTSSKEYSTEKLVITAGPWSPTVLPDLSNVVTVQRQVVAWFETRNPAAFSTKRFPVFNAEFEEGRFYGFPEYACRGFKIGKYFHLHEDVDPENISRVVSDCDIAVLRACVEKYFPAANGRVLQDSVCMFTNTEDFNFRIGESKSHRGVFYATGFSGHGFKFANLIGQLLTDLVAEQAPRSDVSPFVYIE